MAETRLDAVPLRAIRSPQGYLRDSPIVARTGVQTYRMGGRLVREYKPESVYDAAALAAIQAIPLIDTHKAITAANVRDHVIGTVLSPGRLDGETVVADVVLYDDAPTKAGRKELSLAYSVEVDPTPGTAPDGSRFDQRVTCITAFDHLALVERGRAGVARLRLDGADAVSAEFDSPDGVPAELAAADPSPAPPATPASPANNVGIRPECPSQEGQKMAETPLPLVPIRLDGVTVGVAPDVATAIEKMRADAATAADKLRADAEAQAAKARDDIAAATRRADALEVERDALKAEVAKHPAAVAQARTDAVAEVKARLVLEAEAGKHGVEVRADMSDRAVREAVVNKLAPDTYRFDGKSDEWVGFAYDHALADAAKRAANAAAQTAQATPSAAANAATAPAVRADAASTPTVARSAADVARAMAAAGQA